MCVYFGNGVVYFNNGFEITYFVVMLSTGNTIVKLVVVLELGALFVICAVQCKQLKMEGKVTNYNDIS